MIQVNLRILKKAFRDDEHVTFWEVKFNHTRLESRGLNPSLKLTANASENRPSQREIHLPTIDFQGRTVSFREGKKRQSACFLLPKSFSQVLPNSGIALALAAFT